jgi:hypothetical protein
MHMMERRDILLAAASELMLSGAAPVHVWFGATPTALRDEPSGPHARHYRIDKVARIRGENTPGPAAGWTMTRLESPQRLQREATLTWQGVTGHLQYTTSEQSAALSSSRGQFVGGEDEVQAVLIPIRKSGTWWAMPQDQRQSHFAGQAGKEGHTQIGVPYATRIFRRLYHARYLGNADDWDFLTYFEFLPASADAFRQLLGKLRDPQVNPEWSYVDRECEIWMTVRR